MDGTHDSAKDGARWHDAIDPIAEEDVLEAIDALAELPVLDGTVLRVVALVDDPDTTTADIVAVLEHDATFAANLLRFANSAARAQPIRAKTIRQAVMLVGRKALRRLALEAATYRFLERVPGNGTASRGHMHVHALAVGLASAGVAERIGAPADVPHLAGLLHGVGKLVLPLAFGDAACDEVARAHPDGPQRVIAEREAFGLDHAQAGALLARRWGLPADITAAIAFQHGGISGVSSPTVEAACVQIGGALVDMVNGAEPDHALLEVALERSGLPAADLDDVALQAVQPGAMGAVAHGGPGTLAARVSELERLSQTDDLTGVDNRRHWLQTTRLDLREARPGAVLLCDVDHLKAVNDEFGHGCGDMVLTEIARVLSRHGRAGRLGGDEFAVWVRGDRTAAEDAAARIAAEVDVAFAEADESGGPATDVSIGIAIAPEHGTELAELLETADVALYAAKDLGRACTVVADAPAPRAEAPLDVDRPDEPAFRVRGSWREAA